MANISTLVEDIYSVLETSQAAEGVDADQIIEEFGEAMKKLLKSICSG